MKITSLLMIILLAAGITACKDDEEKFFPSEIDKVISDLNASFDTLDFAMGAAAAVISLDVSDTAKIRTKLQNLYNLSTFSQNFAFINDQQILQMIEPPDFYSSQGSDVSGQAHVQKMFQSGEPVLSDVFFAVEGYYAAADLHPVTFGAQIHGGISTLFLPEVVLGRIILPYVSGMQFEMWVMEKGGRVLYDQDADEIGLNVITDPLYQDFPELVAAAQLIASDKSGETSYSFYQTGTTNKVVKKTYWNTVDIHGTEWKVVWVKPE